MRCIKAIITILIIIVSSKMCLAQSEATVVYIEQYRKIAVQEMKRTGIPASITLAQGILESNSGESPLAKKYNNHFGIKCKTDWKGETTLQDDDAKNECFRVYPTAAASFTDHSNFLKNRPNYSNLFLLDPLDDSAWAIGLKKAGYATAPDYAKKLLKVIDDYELSQYNFPELDDEIDESTETLTISKKEKLTDTSINVSIKKVENIDSTKDDNPVVQNRLIDTTTLAKKDTAITIAVKSDTTMIQLSSINGINSNNASSIKLSIPKVNSLPNEPKDTVVIVEKPIKKDTIATANKNTINIPKGVFKINGTSVIWSLAGTSYLAIANQYHIPLFKLFEYNDMAAVDLIEKDQLVFLELKKKTGAKSLHTVKEGESLYLISQLEAIQYDYLKAYNPTINNNSLKEGTIVFLFKQKEEAPTTIEKVKSKVEPKNNLFKKLFNKQ